MAELLLHSLKEFDELIFTIAERMEPRGVLEIGAETGSFTERMLAFCARRKIKITTLDPNPSRALVELARDSTTLDLHIGLSIPYLEEHGTDADLVLIDGDHNYFTVSRELLLVHAAWQKQDLSGVMLVHDVGFPCAERDMYYFPATIPEDARHAHSFTHGVTLGSPGLVRGGMRGEGAFAWAERAGGEKNGVLTAVRDFVREHPQYSYRSVDAVFGLGALTLAGSRVDASVREVFGRYDNALVRRLERNRLELYLKVLELQDRLARLQQSSAGAAP
jgi:predicted O-methyltransferase YrrM